MLRDRLSVPLLMVMVSVSESLVDEHWAVIITKPWAVR